MASRGSAMLVELKTGETYNGVLNSCDTWMNLNLKEVICTSKEGDKFWQIPEVFIKGTTVKYIRVADEVIDKVRDYQKNKLQSGNQRGRGRGRGKPY